MLNSQINNKSIARIAAIQTLYQFDINSQEDDINTSLLQIIDFYRDKDLKSDYEMEAGSLLKPTPSFNFLKELVKYTHDNLTDIDPVIAKYVINEETVKTLPKLLFATLRVSVCEMKYFPSTPRKVIINEYTDIASAMLGEAQVGFVNSILDKYAHSES